MKYCEIKEDNEILKGKTLSEIAVSVGCNPSYVSLLKNNKRVASWKLYQRLKKAFGN